MFLTPESLIIELGMEGGEDLGVAVVVGVGRGWTDQPGAGLPFLRSSVSSPCQSQARFQGLSRSQSPNSLSSAWGQRLEATDDTRSWILVK